MMPMLPLAANSYTEWWLQLLLGVAMFVVSLFLVLLVLIQRGRGGGLTGALGGAGGQSAFGTKAGDIFTRITIVFAALWILLAVISIKVLGTPKAESTRAKQGTEQKDPAGRTGIDAVQQGKQKEGDPPGPATQGDLSSPDSKPTDPANNGDGK